MDTLAEAVLLDALSSRQQQHHHATEQTMPDKTAPKVESSMPLDSAVSLPSSPPAARLRHALWIHADAVSSPAPTPSSDAGLFQFDSSSSAAPSSAPRPLTVKKRGHTTAFDLPTSPAPSSPIIAFDGKPMHDEQSHIVQEGHDGDVVALQQLQLPSSPSRGSARQALTPRRQLTIQASPAAEGVQSKAAHRADIAARAPALDSASTLASSAPPTLPATTAQTSVSDATAPPPAHPAPRARMSKKARRARRHARLEPSATDPQPISLARGSALIFGRKPCSRSSFDPAATFHTLAVTLLHDDHNGNNDDDDDDNSAVAVTSDKNGDECKVRDVLVPAQATHASRVHCVVSRSDARALNEDAITVSVLGSNGLLVNGQLVRANESLAISAEQQRELTLDFHGWSVKLQRDDHVQPHRPQIKQRRLQQQQQVKVQTRRVAQPKLHAFTRPALSSSAAVASSSKSFIVADATSKEALSLPLDDEQTDPIFAAAASPASSALSLLSDDNDDDSVMRDDAHATPAPALPHSTQSSATRTTTSSSSSRKRTRRAASVDENRGYVLVDADADNVDEDDEDAAPANVPTEALVELVSRVEVDRIDDDGELTEDEHGMAVDSSALASSSRAGTPLARLQQSRSRGSSAAATAVPPPEMSERDYATASIGTLAAVRHPRALELVQSAQLDLEGLVASVLVFARRATLDCQEICRSLLGENRAMWDVLKDSDEDEVTVPDMGAKEGSAQHEQAQKKEDEAVRRWRATIEHVLRSKGMFGVIENHGLKVRVLPTPFQWRTWLTDRRTAYAGRVVAPFGAFVLLRAPQGPRAIARRGSRAVRQARAWHTALGQAVLLEKGLVARRATSQVSLLSPPVNLHRCSRASVHRTRE